jgi:quercetin dioxygenase-like cupin family protein
MGATMKQEKVIKGKEILADTRGAITNYDMPEPVTMLATISSTKGAVRANHYHPVQTQKCILIKGRYRSFYKDLSDHANPVKSHVIEPGDLVVTPPNVAHAMVFLEDSIFLNLVTGDREPEKFGEHTVPYELVDEKGNPR